MISHHTNCLIKCPQICLGTSESKERRQEYQLKLASAQQRLGQSSEAVQQLFQLLHGPLAFSDQPQRLQVECQLADLQVSQMSAPCICQKESTWKCCLLCVCTKQHAHKADAHNRRISHAC